MDQIREVNSASKFTDGPEVDAMISAVTASVCQKLRLNHNNAWLEDGSPGPDVVGASHDTNDACHR